MPLIGRHKERGLLDKIAIENPDLPYEMIQGILLGLEEERQGKIEEYKFGA